MRRLSNRLKSVLAGAVAAAVLTGAPLSAGKDDRVEKYLNPTKINYLVEKTIVMPGGEEQFEAAWSRIADYAEEHDYSYQTAVASRKNVYYWFTPIKNYADIDYVNAGRLAANEAGGEAFDQAVVDLNAVVTDRTRWVLHLRDDLSYRPDTMKMGGNIWNHMDIDIYTVKAGHNEKLALLLSEIKALYEKMNIKQGYQVYEYGLGGGGNNIAIARYGYDQEALLRNTNQARRKVMGSKKGRALFDQFRQHIVGTDQEMMAMRKDLALIPHEKLAEKAQ